MSNNIIFYFSGTGNSLKAARDIAAKLDSCDVVSMRNTGSLSKQYERIGFVYPTYATGLPKHVLKFIQELELGNNQDAYVFAVTTCGGGPGNAIAMADKLLSEKGYTLSYGNHVMMFANYVGLYPMAANPKERAEASDKVINEIGDAVRNKEILKKFKSSAVMSLIYKAFSGTFPKKDKGFNVSDACNGCKMCANVCPVENITIQNNKPAFANHCEQCMACIQWCPKQAINYKNKTQTHGRYHHPAIKYQDMIK